MSNFTASPSQALTDSETERLATRLSKNSNPDALSLEAVDGLFCALIASPDVVGPSQYMAVILGDESGNSMAFADLKDAGDTLSLLMRYWNSIAEDFQSGDHIHMPYIENPGTNNIPGRDWARGFMRGTRLAPRGWDRLFKDEKEGTAIAIPLVAGEIDEAWPKEPLTSEKANELLEWMFAGAARAYRYFEPDRRELAEHARFDTFAEEDDYPETYVRPERKIGRNEPCPCGSGRKFKKCCGSPDIGPTH
jgi:uncharacterized protein